MEEATELANYLLLSLKGIAGMRPNPELADVICNKVFAVEKAELD
jgi:hypothetical protein